MKKDSKMTYDSLLPAVLWRAAILIASIASGYFLAHKGWFIEEVNPPYIYGCLGYFLVMLIIDLRKHCRQRQSIRLVRFAQTFKLKY